MVQTGERALLISTPLTFAIHMNKEDIVKLKKHVGEPYTRPFTDYVSKDGELVRVAKETTFNNLEFTFSNDSV